MKKKWTRRKFLEGSLIQITLEAAPQPGLSRDQRERLGAAMDEIIPEGEGMPAASAVGGVEYLDRVVRQWPDLKAQLETALGALDRSFVRLSRADRLAALAALERQTPDLFRSLRDAVYEAYYTQPQVWKLIGYESHLTNHKGPRMKPFDEAVLAQVRKKPKFYREVT